MAMIVVLQTKRITVVRERGSLRGHKQEDSHNQNSSQAPDIYLSTKRSISWPTKSSAATWNFL